MTETMISALITLGLITLIALWVPCQVGFEKGCARLRGRKRNTHLGPKLVGPKVELLAAEKDAA